MNPSAASTSSSAVLGPPTAARRSLGSQPHSRWPSMDSPTLRRHQDALETRFALRVVSSLSEQQQNLPHNISERLRAAREQALAHARQRRAMATTTAPQPALVLAGAAQSQAGRGWFRLASLLPLLVLVLGFLLIDHEHTASKIAAAADVDAALLADEVPVAAYTDPGFVEFLKTPSSR